MKLSKLLANSAVTSTGFPAIAGLGSFSKGTNPVVLSALATPVLFAQGITDYFSLTLPRGSKFETSQDIIDADPDVQHWAIKAIDVSDMPVALTTQHQATLDVLIGLYPDADVLNQRNADSSPRNLSAADVEGKHIIGVLPPFLIAKAGAFTSTSIPGYNAFTDGDLSVDEIKDRLVIADVAITVEEIV